jgi:hypothetical protein
MSDSQHRSTFIWWAIVLAGAAAALLFTWLARLAGVPMADLLSIGAGLAALAWMIVVVTVPWNLYFAARQVVADMEGSRARDIAIRPAQEAEAARIARRMLWFALGGHLGTAVVAAVVSYLSGAVLGYYAAGFYLLSTAIRPATAYFAHLRGRIGVLSQEAVFPRDDVVSLKHLVDTLGRTVRTLQAELRQAQERAADDLRHAESRLADDIAHLRQQMTADLGRLQDAQAEDRAAAHSRAGELGRRLGQLTRRIEATMEGVSDHQELLTGLRALVRMIRSEPA